MRRFTHLGRKLSAAYPSHRALFGLVTLAGVAGWLDPARHGPARSMFGAALTVALVWMLIQELDADLPWLALVGATGAGGLVLLTGDVSLAALVLLMLASRILVRSTGLVPRLPDILTVGLFAGMFARTPLAWAGGLAVAAAVALDTGHSHPAPARYMWLALSIGVAVTITAVFSDALDLAWTTPPPGTALLAVAALVLLMTGSRRPNSLNDVLEPYDPDRLRAARLLVIMAATLGTLAGGGAYAAASWPVWIGMLTAGVTAHLRRWSA